MPALAHSVSLKSIAAVLGGGRFSPLALFAASEPGGWYDPSDLTTLFQDAAGTTPVTAVEQPVGRVLDKSGRGNHLSQSTSTARPVLSARVNLLTQTEDFSAAAWSTAGSITSRTSNSITGTGVVQQSASIPLGVVYSYSLEVKADTADSIVIMENSGAGIRFTYSGAVISNAGGTVISSSATLLPDGYYRITYTAAVASFGVMRIGFAVNGGTNLIRKADLRPSNAGVGLPAYQRVTTSTDYDTGFPLYLKFDGVDDRLQAATFALQLVERMTLVGLRENAVGQYSGVLSVYPATGNDYNSTTGYFFGTADRSASRFWMEGSTGYNPTWTANPADLIPPTVITEDKTSGAGYLRANGAQVGSDTTFTEFATTSDGGLLIGHRWIGGVVYTSTYRFNGCIYGIVLLGRRATAAEIASAETWMNSKTRAY